jgi:copper resistance protein C
VRTFLTIALAACALFASLPAAQAHAFIDHAEPAVGGKVLHTPKQVRIWFTEALEAAFSSIKVLDQGGHELQQGKALADKANPQILQIGVPSLPAGTYKVVWRAVSVDTHVTTGSFTFSVAP